MLPRDAELLFVEIAREADHFHAVKQRPRNGVELIRRADEQHLG